MKLFELFYHSRNTDLISGRHMTEISKYLINTNNCLECINLMFSTLAKQFC